MSSKTIAINVSNLKVEIKKRLSFIGKRQSDKQGETLFACVTLSSTEEAILEYEIYGAARTFASELSPKIKGYCESDSAGSIEFYTYGLSDAKAGAVEQIFTNYAVAFVGKATLGKNYPELSKEFADEMNGYLESVIRLAYSMDHPALSNKALPDMTGGMYTDDNILFTTTKN